MKKDSHAPKFLTELRKVPIVQVACEKVGISRNTIYRWLKEDKQFAKDFAEAVKKLLTDNELYEKIQKNARKSKKQKQNRKTFWHL